MRKTALAALGASLVLALAVAAAALAVRRPREGPVGTSPPAGGLLPAAGVGHPMPEFTLPTPQGEALSFAALKNRPVVVNFFASWCPSCWVEIPHLKAVFAEHGVRGLVVLGIGVLDDAASQAWMVRKLEIPYPTVYDAGGEVVSKVLQLRAMPTTIFVDRAGIVRGRWEGFLDERELRRELRKIL